MKKIIMLLLSMLFCYSSFSCEKMDVAADTEVESVRMIPFLTFEDWEKRQGGAIYNGKLVCLNALDKGSDSKGFIYDVCTGKKICDITFNSTIGDYSYALPHANQVSFGSDFYDDKSEFPLLYVSQVNGGSGNNDFFGEGGVLVYNLEKIGENYYNPVLVQAIRPKMTDTALVSKIGRYTPNYIVDMDKKELIVIGYPNNSWYDLSGSQPIALFKLPSISAGPEIVLTNEDVIDSYTLPTSLVIQQSFYYCGKVFTACGFRNQAALRVLNLSSKTVEAFFDMSELTFGEPQFIGLWGSKVLYYEYNTSGIVYELIIPGYTFNDNKASIVFGREPTYTNQRTARYNLQGLPSQKKRNEIQIVITPEGTKKTIR